jgi:MFS family permease
LSCQLPQTSFSFFVFLSFSSFILPPVFASFYSYFFALLYLSFLEASLVLTLTLVFGYPSGAYNGILASALSLGSVIGLPFIPLVNDTFGRRWCIMFGSWTMILGRRFRLLVATEWAN